MGTQLRMMQDRMDSLPTIPEMVIFSRPVMDVTIARDGGSKPVNDEKDEDVGKDPYGPNDKNNTKDLG